MSYGYLVISTRPIPELQKNRRFSFALIESSDGFFAYTRLEERNELTIRHGEKTQFTPAGKDFFSALPKPFFFMDYLLMNKQGEKDLINTAKSILKTCRFSKIHIDAGKELSLNCLYEVCFEETLKKAASGMKRKAHGAQRPRHIK